MKNEQVDFEETLLLLQDKLKDNDYANKMYAALCNTTWIHESNITYGCTWRYAGGLIATIRNMDETYLHFYCNGNEGIVDPEIANDLKKYNWTYEILK